MKFMLDTNICIDLIRRRDERILHKLKRRDLEDICVSAVTLSELEYGVAKSSNPTRNRLVLAEFMTPLAVMPFDGSVTGEYGRIRADLERKGMPIGPLDTMIAAHALTLGLVLVTSNEQEFRRVPGLQVQNWAK